MAEWLAPDIPLRDFTETHFVLGLQLDLLTTRKGIMITILNSLASMWN